MPDILCTADDAGLTQGVTGAIMECLDSGCLQGTSVMAGGFYAMPAMRLLRDRPEAIAAVHLNLLEGRSCAPSSTIPDLVDEAGFFRHTLASVWRALSLGSGRKKDRFRAQVLTEFRAQIDTVRQGLGTETVRLDGHLHVHAMPGLLPVMEEIFRTVPVAYVRIPCEIRHFPALPPRLLPSGIIRRELLAAWSGPLRLLAAKHGIPTPDMFIGAYASGHMNLESLKRGLAALVKKSGGRDARLVEIMLHPGRISTENTTEERAWYARSRYREAHESPARRGELAMLRSTEFRAALRDAGTASDS